MKDDQYKKAYERQKQAREQAEAMLEERSRELFDANRSLSDALNKLQDQQENLIQQEKLAALGMLAAGVAHEINNPIGFVDSNLQMLDIYFNKILESLNFYEELRKSFDNLESDPAQCRQFIATLDELPQKNDLYYLSTDGKEVIAECLDGTRRVARIVSQLRNYARTNDDPMGFLNLNENIDDILKLVSNELKYKCEIVKNFGKLQPVYGSGTQLGQVFLNIIINAAQAIEERGTITITTSQDQESATIKIQDDGIGISAENLKKIYDPFFTTKDVGSGTGLGLSIVQGIIKKHRGNIHVSTQPRKGTTFTINLPLYPSD